MQLSYPELYNKETFTSLVVAFMVSFLLAQGCDELRNALPPPHKEFISFTWSLPYIDELFLGYSDFYRYK